MKKHFITVSSVLTVIIFLSCNAKNNNEPGNSNDSNDPNGPEASAIKMMNDICRQKSGGVLKVTGFTPYYPPYTGSINGLEYYYVSTCFAELEVTKDSSYADCYTPNNGNISILNFDFTDSPRPTQDVYNNNLTRVTGSNSSCPLKKGQQYTCDCVRFEKFYDTTLATRLIFVKRSGNWVQPEEADRHLILNSIYGPNK